MMGSPQPVRETAAGGFVEGATGGGGGGEIALGVEGDGADGVVAVQMRQEGCFRTFVVVENGER
jgi:hypothetical protein